MLSVLRSVSPLRRMLLGAPGTLQGMLTAYWGAPVTIHRIAQEDGLYRTLRREVELECRERDLVACHALTHMRLTDEAMAALLRESDLGIGQVITLLRRQASFALELVGDDESTFWRRYRLAGDGFDFQIRETFQKALYPDLPEPT